MSEKNHLSRLRWKNKILTLGNLTNSESDINITSFMTHANDASHGIANSRKCSMHMSTQAFSTENLILIMKKINSIENKWHTHKPNTCFPTKNGTMHYLHTKIIIEEQNTIENLPKIFDENIFELVDGLIQIAPHRKQNSCNSLSSLNKLPLDTECTKG